MLSARHRRPPPSWSWHRVDEEEARAWTRATGRRLLPGRYSSPSFNQHASGWCGACYAAAAVQMVEDRCNILVASKTAHAVARPFVRINVQAVLDDYDRHSPSRTTDVAWNACAGGDPFVLLHCLKKGLCRLLLLPAGGGAPFKGHPSAREPTQKREVHAGARPAVDAVRRVRPTEDDLMEEVHLRGPVLCGINARAMIQCDEAGRIDASLPNVADHAAVVVGWRRERSDVLFLVRSTWGEEAVPTNLPSDLSCVGPGFNVCAEALRPWTGVPDLPGHVLVPSGWLLSALPSPSLLACDVRL